MKDKNAVKPLVSFKKLVLSTSKAIARSPKICIRMLDSFMGKDLTIYTSEIVYGLNYLILCPKNGMWKSQKTADFYGFFCIKIG